MSSESAHLSQNLPKKQPQNEAIKRYAKNKMRKQTNAMSSPSRHPIPNPKQPSHGSNAAKSKNGDNHHTSIRYPKCRQKCKIDISLKEKGGKQKGLVPSCVMLPGVV